MDGKARRKQRIKISGEKPQELPLRAFADSTEICKKNMKLSWWVYFGLNAKEFLSSISNMAAIVIGQTEKLTDY